MTTRPPRTGPRIATLGLAGFLGAAGPALAEDVAPAPSREASPAPAPAPKVEVTGFVDVYYGYGFNQSDPLLRTFDVQHDAFSLSLAEVAFTKAPTADSRVGFRVDLDFGRTADLVAAFEPESDGKEVYKHVQQGYVSLLAGNVQIDAGKFVTPIGAEVIESQDNWNYTRSILFGYAIPFYHLGVRATVPVGEKLSLSGHLVNGWNNGYEVDGQKTYAIGATVKPTGQITWIANYMGGKEAEGLDTRHLFDTTLTVGATDGLSLVGNFDYGKEGDATWWGVAAYARLQARPSWALAARFEHVDDTGGGFMTIGARAQSLTLTSDHVVAGALGARLEYRTDFASEDLFATDDGSFVGSQTTLTVGLVYSFGAGLF
jgi:hypothetical protein